MGALGSALDLLKQQVDLTRWGRFFLGNLVVETFELLIKIGGYSNAIKIGGMTFYLVSWGF